MLDKHGRDSYRPRQQAVEDAAGSWERADDQGTKNPAAEPETHLDDPQPWRLAVGPPAPVARHGLDAPSGTPNGAPGGSEAPAALTTGPELRELAERRVADTAAMVQGPLDAGAVSRAEDTPGDGHQSQVLPAADGAGDGALLRRWQDETVRLATSLAGQPPDALVAAVKARHPDPDEQRRVLDRIRQAASCASVGSPAAERPSPATNAVDPPSMGRDGSDGSDGLVAPVLVSSPGVRAL